MNLILSIFPYIFLGIALIGNGVEVIRRKKNAYFFLLLLVVCWLMSWTTVGGPDYYAYLDHYQQIDFPSWQYFSEMDVGYNVLVFLFSRVLNLSFNAFRASFYIVGFALIGKQIWRYSRHPNAIILVYAFTLLAIDTVQIRNFIASVFLLVSFQYMFDRKAIRLTVMILLSALFHKIFLVYLLIPVSVVLFREFDSTKFKRTLIIIGGVMVLLQIAKPLIAFSVENLENYITILRDNYYFRGGLVRRSYLVYWCYQFLVILFFMKYSTEEKSRLPFKSSNAYSILLNVNMWFLLFVPLFLFNSNFLRIYRNMFLINAIFIYEGFSESEKKTIIEPLLLLFLWAVSLYGFSAASNCVPPLFFESLLFRLQF